MVNVATRRRTVGRNRQILGSSGYNRLVSISRRIARPLLASAFIAEGWSAIRNPDPGGEAAPEALGVAAAETAGEPPIPGADNVVALVRLNGAVQVGGGVLLALGKFPRLASLALMGTIIPTTYAGHRFWEEPDDETRARKKMQLLKNLGLLGGLIFSAVDTEGAPSVSWRTRRRVRQLAESVSQRQGTSEVHAHETASKAVDKGRKAAGSAKKAATQASPRANIAAVDAVREANVKASRAARSGVVVASPYLHHANESAHEAAGDVLDAAGPYISAGLERTGELLEEALEAAGPYISAGFGRAGELLARVPEHFSD